MIDSKVIIKIFDQLEGKYSIKRIIGNEGIGEGFAYFSGYDNNAIKKTLIYHEELNIHYYNSRCKIKAIKEYLYILENNEISKSFWEENNKLLFYKMNFINNKFLQASASHKCNLDIYKAKYIFYNHDSFDLSYEISGPNKDYTIKTRFNKIKV